MKRAEAIAMLKSKMDGSVDTSHEWAETIRMAIEALTRPQGEWSEDCKCTICGFEDEDFGLSQIIRCNFCPNCGARMI